MAELGGIWLWMGGEGDMERDRTNRTGWTSWTGRTDGTGRRETPISNNEHRILNGEAEIGGVLWGGWFNRFLDKLGMTKTALGMTKAALGMTKAALWRHLRRQEETGGTHSC